MCTHTRTLLRDRSKTIRYRRFAKKPYGTTARCSEFRDGDATGNFPRDSLGGREGGKEAHEILNKIKMTEKKKEDKIAIGNCL